MSYDVKSEELAVHFLSDEPALDTDANRDELAQAIQDAVESWFHGKQSSPDEASSLHSEEGQKSELCMVCGEPAVAHKIEYSRRPRQ